MWVRPSLCKGFNSAPGWVLEGSSGAPAEITDVIMYPFYIALLMSIKHLTSISPVAVTAAHSNKDEQLRTSQANKSH